MAETASVAGWEDDRGEWIDVEAGGRPPSPDELASSNQIVIGVTDDDGERHYYTTSYLTDDYGIDEVLADWEGDYGVQFV